MTNTKSKHVAYTYVSIISNENAQKIVVIAMYNVMIYTNKSCMDCMYCTVPRCEGAKKVSSRSGLIASQASSKTELFWTVRCPVGCVGR